MSRQTSVHDLESLVQSYHSLIVVETVEEERVRSIVMEVATRLQAPMVEWSISDGLRRRSGTTLEGTKDALSMLQRIDEIHERDSLYLLKDLGPHLQHPNVVRLLRDLVTRAAATHSAIVLTGDPVELPRDIDGLAVRYELQLPDQNEIREVIRQVVDSISARKQIRVDLSRDDAHRLVRALSGLTLSQVRSAVARAILEDEALTVADIDRIVRGKGEIIQRAGVLEFFPIEGNNFQLGASGV